MSAPLDPAVQQHLVQLAVRLGQVVRQAQIYGDEHPALDAAVDAVVDHAAALLDAVGPVGFALAMPRFVARGTGFRPPAATHAALRELQEYLAERGLGGLDIHGALRPGLVMKTVRLLHEQPAGGLPGPDVFNDLLQARGIRALSFSRVRVARDDSAAGGARDPALVCLRLYLRGVRAVQRLLERGPSPAVVLEMTRLGRGFVDMLEAAPQRVLALGTPRQLVPYELRHPVHMAVYSIALGHRFGLRDEQLVDLAVCALLVDAGMAAVDPETRAATGALSDAERAAMQAHPVSSVQLLLGLPELTPRLRRRLVVSMEHHIGVDWRGYPAVQRWTDLHPFSRIISVADGFDALLANRPGRTGLSAADALDVLRQEAGSRYDPLMVDHLDSMMRDHLGLGRAATMTAQLEQLGHV